MAIEGGIDIGLGRVGRAVTNHEDVPALLQRRNQGTAIVGLSVHKCCRGDGGKVTTA